MIARAVTVETADWLVQDDFFEFRIVQAQVLRLRRSHRHRLPAVPAQHAHQALSQNAVQRGDEVVGLDPHIDEPANDIKRVIRMHGGENQMPGQRRLDGDLRGLRIPDLADHDLVGVMPQNRA